MSARLLPVYRERESTFPGVPLRQSGMLELLAHEVGLSRSALAERFTQFVGQPPM